MVQPWVCDYSEARPGAQTLINAGCVGVMRYSMPRFDGAAITPAEVADFDAHGLAYGLVMEFSANWTSGGYNAGNSNAKAARIAEDNMGIPRGVTYAAVDWDVTLGGPPQSAQALANCQAVLACCHGMADAYGGWEYVGIYGSKWICEWIAANSPITHLWSTDAWSNYVPANGASLHQHAVWPAGVPVVGGCDHNLILNADWGARTTTEDDLTPQQDKLLTTIAGAVYQSGLATAQIQADQKAQDKVIALILADVAALKSAPVTTGGTVDPAPIIAEIKSLTFKAQ